MVSREFKQGPIICHCLNVTEQELREAIRDQKITSVEDVSRQTQAGQGCTACLPFLQKLLKEEPTR